MTPKHFKDGETYQSLCEVQGRVKRSEDSKNYYQKIAAHTDFVH
jgi:hypothetical protein